MRKAEKQMALALIETLKQAHEEIVDSINQNMPQQAMNVLADCQECAVQLGTFIEKTEGEEFAAIKLIERYCEILYKIYTELQQTGIAGCSEIQTELSGQISEIESSIQHNIKERLEIVFLPYKVSMWDSLESVWKAAEADEQCDAYVIPIPYYDKNPDGSFRELHFEGGEYPEYVPITWYKDYDFEQRKPDAIFIHNPYDNDNYVTSVHPSFYSYELKKYTDQLVYIPYYISDEPNDNVLDAISYREGFVLTEGVLNADKVFVQSESAKGLFIRILEKNFPEKEKTYWERKVWGLGSPKCDRVNAIARDDCKLPQSWRDIIYTTSGVRKKVVFYNISLSPLLQNDDMLNKIKDVLAFFKEADDIVLWWRPHPLYESTLASMRQELLPQYQQMVAQYKKEKWGIFDEGVDLEWAIAETDAYYGDSSSVIHLYEEVQKPVMMQNLETRETDKLLNAADIPIWPSAFCVDEDTIWLMHGKINLLMRYHLYDNCMHIVGVVPGDGMAEMLYGGMHKWKNKIYLIPLNAKELTVYDLETKQFRKKQLGDRKGRLFQKVHQKDAFLYCMPAGYGQEILKFHMESEKAEFLTIPEKKENYICDTARVGDIVIAVYAHTNRGLLLDLNTETISSVTLGSEKRQYTAIASVENAFYLFDKPTGWIVRIDVENGGQEKEIYKKEGTVRMTTISSSMLLIDDIQNHEMQILSAKGTVIPVACEEKKLQKRSLCASGCDYIGNTKTVSPEIIFYFSENDYCMYGFEEGRLKAQISMKLGHVELEKIQELVSNMEETGTKPLIENDIYNLDRWIKAIRKRKAGSNKTYRACGEKILQAVKEDLLQSAVNE